MRMIDEFESAHDAQIASLNYRDRGILTHVSSSHSNSLWVITGARKVGLWVVLEDQYQDAIELGKDTSYCPATALSEDEMVELELLGKKQLEESSSKILSAMGYGFVVLALTVYIGYVFHGLLNNR